jgi:hypothetical protein
VLVALITAGPATLAAVAALLSARWSHGARKELRPNSGSSTKDAIDRIEVELGGLKERITGLEDHVRAPVQLVSSVGEVAPMIPPKE